MNARDTWQALQARLTAARAAFDAGDREAALAEITAALDIDPSFLAALSLRDRVLSPESAVAEPRRGVLREELNSSRHIPSTPCPNGPPASAPTPVPQVSADGYAKFELRAKRRRADRRLDAARAALGAGRFKAAAAALDEVIELDPNMPELAALTAEFDRLHRTTSASHRGRRLAAAAAFAITLLGTSWLQDSTSMTSRPAMISSPMIASWPLIAAPTAAVPPPAEPSAIGDGGPASSPATEAESSGVRTAAISPMVTGPADTNETMPRTERESMPAVMPASASAAGPAVVPASMAPAPAAVPAAAPAAVPPVAAPLRTAALNESPATAPMPAPASALPPAGELADDNILVKQALQRYRSAYEGLDARSAQAVWPAVNQAALARAFDGLESQALIFDACDVRVGTDSATATCQGSARYVPKIGNRYPRVEPRVWNFTLRKNDGDWKIDSARAER